MLPSFSSQYLMCVAASLFHPASPLVLWQENRQEEKGVEINKKARVETRQVTAHQEPCIRDRAGEKFETCE